MFLENGPFRMLENGTLIENPHSWTHVANVLYGKSNH
jgi:carboxypeptidase C (cathepsin A)